MVYRSTGLLGVPGYMDINTPSPHSNGRLQRFRLLRRQNNWAPDHLVNGDTRTEFVDDGLRGDVC